MDNQHVMNFNIMISDSEKRKSDLYGYMHIPSDLQYNKVQWTISISNFLEIMAHILLILGWIHVEYLEEWQI